MRTYLDYCHATIVIWEDGEAITCQCDHWPRHEGDHRHATDGRVALVWGDAPMGASTRRIATTRDY